MKITNKLLLERIEHLHNKGYAESTIERYFTDFKLFMEWWRENIGNTITSENLTLVRIEKRTRYLHEKITPKTSIYYTIRTTISQGTIEGKKTSIKSLLKYLNYYYDTGLDYRKIEIKKCKSDYIEAITENEFNLLMEFIGNFEKFKINALRSQLLVNIGFTSGMRLSEMLSLKIDDIKRKEIRITGKGNKTRWVFFTSSSVELLENYLEEREKPIPRTGIKENGSDFVFISHNSGYDYGKPIKKNTVCEKIKKYSDSLDIGKRITIHSLRHGYATKLLENGLNIREIQELLGHKDIQTTEGYTHILKSSLKNKVMGIFN